MSRDEQHRLPFECRVEPHRDLVHVCPVGELDLATVEEVEARLEELRSRGFDRLVLDLRDTTFIDSTGLRLAVSWHDRARHENFGFALIQGPDAVRRIFELADLSGRLRFLE
jgi:anti-anti-sigma factor